jgi:hypothetical protein
MFAVCTVSHDSTYILPDRFVDGADSGYWFMV